MRRFSKTPNDSITCPAASRRRAALRPAPAKHFVAIDPALANTGVAAVAVSPAGALSLAGSMVVETLPATPLHLRLRRIGSEVARFVSAYPGADLAIEDFAFGAKLGRETMGRVDGALLVYLSSRLGSGFAGLERVGIRRVKQFYCPRWPGFSRALWEAAGARGKFKRSMPGKGDIGSALGARFGLFIHNEHITDAAAIAVYRAVTLGFVPSD